MAVPEVKVKIGADTAGLQDGLNKASGNMRAFAKSAGAAVAKGIAAIGVAAAGAGVALLAFARAQGDVIDANMKTARSLGLTHNQFAAMAQVAGEAGVQTGQLSAMLGIMQRNIIELGKGTATQADAFGRLGLSMQDMAGKSPADQFALIAEKLDQVEDPATRTATAMDLLGKSGRGAINMLENYSQKVQDAAAYQEKFGLAVSDVDASNIEAANDAMGRVYEAVKGVGRMIASYLAPLVWHVADMFLSAKMDAEDFGEFGGRAVANVGAYMDFLRRTMLLVQIGVGTITAAMQTFAAVGIAGISKLQAAYDSLPWVNGDGSAVAGLEADAASFAKASEETLATVEKHRAAWEGFEKTADVIARVRAEAEAAMAAAGGGDRSDSRTIPEKPDVSIPGIAGASKVAEDMAARFAALEESLRTEREVVDAWYAESLEALRLYNLSKQIEDERSLEARARLEAEYAARIQALEESKNTQIQRGSDEAASVGLANLSKVFKANKAIAVAQAVTDTYAGATRALKEWPAPYSYAVAATVVAAGLANVQSIMSANAGGGGGGGRRGGAAAGAAPAAPQETTTFRFNITGDQGGFGESFARQFVDQLNSRQRNGGRIIGVIG